MIDSDHVIHLYDAAPPVFGKAGPLDLGDLFDRSKKADMTIVGDGGGHIEWAPSLKEGIREAQSQGKPLVCVFEEDACGWCNKFDQELTKPAADQLGQDAIFVKIRPSQDPEGKGLANSLGISSYPTVSILDINGTNISERSRMTGFMTADQFAAYFAPRHSASVSVLV